MGKKNRKILHSALIGQNIKLRVETSTIGLVSIVVLLWLLVKLL